MYRFMLCCLALATAALVGVSGTRTSAADWPQWRGPDRTGLSKETGLLTEWPKGGPPLAWKATDLGGGYSTPSIADGRIFGMSYRDKDEVVWALDEKTGKEIWATKIATAVKLDRGEGSRSTPTVDGNKLYALGTDGDLVCLSVDKGEKVWTKNLKKDFAGNRPGWGYSESVLIDGDKLICTPGGKNTIVALDKTTGDTIWKGMVPKADGAHYSSVIAVEIEGRKQYLQFVRGGVVAVGASDGEYLWRYDAPANGTANCATPIYHDGHVFAASNYGVGGGLVKVTKPGEKFDAKQVYFDKNMSNHHGGLVLVDGFLYGEGGGQLRCVNFLTDKLGWEERRAGKGSVAYADGHIYFRNERDKGTVILVEANPKEYVEKGRFDPPDRSRSNAWSHPVIANGKLYIRDQGVLLCYDIRKQ
jgi:outer membrane protein assembly factor BamB